MDIKDSKIWELEQIASDLYSLSVMAAMEAGRLGEAGKGIAGIAGNAKLYVTMLRHILKNEKFPNSDAYLVYGNFTSKYNDETEEIEETVDTHAVNEFDEALKHISDLLETTALNGILEGYKINSKSFSICLEEIRLNAVELRKSLKDTTSSRRVWSNLNFQNEIMPINSKSIDLLSFDIGGIQIAEDIGYVKDILKYSLFINKFKEDKSALIGEMLKKSQYIDIYEKLGLKKPDNEDEMSILIIQVPVNPYKKKYLAIPVDYINYPFKSETAKNFESTNKQIKKEYIKACWKSKDDGLTIDMDSDGNETIKELEPTEVLFLNWNEIIK